MFILKKILNSNTTSPDTTYMATAGEGYTYGSFVKVGPDGVLYKLVEGELPTHVCCENIEKDSYKKMLCYPITDDMVFSARSASIMTDIIPGTKFALIQSDADYVNMVEENSVEGNVYVYDTCGAKKFGDRILIRFAQ